MLELLIVCCTLIKMRNSPAYKRSSPMRGEYSYFQVYRDESSEDDQDYIDTRHLIDHTRHGPAKKKALLVMSGLFLLCSGIIGILLYIYLPDKQEETTPVYKASVLGNFSKAAIAIDGEPCAQIGLDVLKDGGSAIDSMIASMFCNGVFNCQSMGIGGGFLMTYYDAKNRTVYSLDARERAPGAATQNMFGGNSSASQRGPLSVAVPGEIAGYWEAKKRFGSSSISWERLIRPTIDMCRTGIKVSWTLASKLLETEPLMTDSRLREVFFNPDTGRPWREGDVYFRPDLADTLEMLARAGDAGRDRLDFYTGQVGRQLVEDLAAVGSIITLQDLVDYSAVWVQPVKVHLSNGGVDVYSVPPPGSGAILTYILNILDEFKIKPTDDIPLLYHRITESFKWAYALRTELGDPADPEIKELVEQLVANMTSENWAADRSRRIKDDQTFQNASDYGAVFYSPDDHGTAHVSILAENGDAVSVTSTINLYFGSLVMSGRTGILLNDEMDDFSAPNITNYFGVPPSPHNFIKGGKRPLSSMCPAVVVDSGSGEVRLVVGAAGGTKITTATAQAILRNLWLGEDVKSSIDKRRLHHQLAPMYISTEPEFPQDIEWDLESKGHQIQEQDSFGSVVNAVARGADGRIYANADFRKAGGVAGY